MDRKSLYKIIDVIVDRKSLYKVIDVIVDRKSLYRIETSLWIGNHCTR